MEFRLADTSDLTSEEVVNGTGRRFGLGGGLRGAFVVGLETVVSLENGFGRRFTGLEGRDAGYFA